MIFESPAQDRIPRLRQLWKEAFGDTDAFLDGFFEYGFSPDRCRCVVKDGAVLSALYWFEGTVEQQRFAYLYAVATAKAARGQGLFSALLSDVKQHLAAQGFDGILLHPEDEALARMYEKFGFRCCAWVDVHRVGAAHVGAEALFKEISVDRYCLLRRAYLPDGAVVQEGNWLPFLSSQYHFFEGEDFLTLGQIYDGCFYAQEFWGNGDCMAPLVGALGVEEGIFRTAGGAVPFVWYLPLHDGCGKPTCCTIALD